MNTAEEAIPGLQQQIEQTENQITLLLGQSPGGIVRGQDFMKQELPPEVPPDCPPRCSKGGRTFSPRSRTWSPPTPTSASRRLRIFRKSA